MTCQQVAQFLIDYVTGELPAQQRDVFERHLAGCRDCRNYLDSYRKTIALERAAFAPTTGAGAGADIPEALVQAVLSACRER